MDLRAEFDALDENHRASFIASSAVLVVFSIASVVSLYFWLN